MQKKNIKNKTRNMKILSVCFLYLFVCVQRCWQTGVSNTIMIMSEGKCIYECVIISINIYEQMYGFDNDAYDDRRESCPQRGWIVTLLQLCFHKYFNRHY